MSALDRQLLAAHNARNGRLPALLYAGAADLSAQQDAAGFFPTHAYIFALEAGLAEADMLRQRLIEMGRETPL